MNAFSLLKAGIAYSIVRPISGPGEFVTMILRSVLRAAGPLSLAAVVVLAPVPAVARDASIGQAAERLSDPRLQGAVATMLSAMTEAMMGIKMAPFAKAMQSMEGMDGEADRPRAQIDPDATLGDMMGPDAERMPQELSARVPHMMDGMAGMAGAMEAMLPQLKAMGERMKDSMPRR